MNLQTLWTLVAKDAALFFRNRFFALITALALMAYVVIYFLMPGTVEERFTAAIYPPDVPQIVVDAFAERDVQVVPAASEAELRAAIEANEYRVGIILPADGAQALVAGEPVRIQAYYPPGIPEDLNRAFTDFLGLVFNDVSYQSSPLPLHITRHEETLGYDLAGQSIAPRDRLLPLFAVLLFVMETLGLANLISEEVERGTARALLVTPLRLREFIAGKSLVGIGLGLAQAALLMAVTGKLGINPLLVLASLLLGALLLTGVGFLIAAVAQDIMGVMSWGMLAIILLGVPSVTVMFPGTISDWVKVIPSYYLVDALHRIVNFNAGWADIAPNLLIMLVVGVVLLVVGALVLRRKLA